MKIAIVCLSAVFGVSLAACADDWSQFRGPTRDGRSAETGLMKSCPDAGPPQVAAISGIGRGYSSPVVVGGRIFVTGVLTAEEPAEAGKDREFVFGFDAAGQEIWRTRISSDFEIKRPLTPRSTPAVRDGRLYVRGLDGAVVCLRADTGQQVWRVPVLQEFGGRVPTGAESRMPRGVAPTRQFFGGDIPSYIDDDGIAESVLLEGGNVICTPGGTNACLVALDAATGKTVWRTPGLSDAPSCSSPVAFDFGAVRQIAQVTATGLVGVRASDGKLLWRHDVQAHVLAPLFADGMVFIGGRAGAVRLTGEGAAVAVEPAFSLTANNGWCEGGFSVCNDPRFGAIIVDGFVYGSSSDYDRARTCVELKTGAVKHRIKEATLCGRATGPIVYADGVLFYQSEFGVVRLVKANPTNSEVIAKFGFPYLEDRTLAHPAISNGRLYIRNNDRLFVYDIRAVAAGAEPAANQAASGTAPVAALPATRNWPQFRGPNRDGKSGETGLLKVWPTNGPPLVAKVDVGHGFGSPSIVDGKVYIPGSSGSNACMECLDMDGRKLWETNLHAGVKYESGSPASPGVVCSTPTVDGDRLYLLTRGGVVMALETAAGRLVWRRDMVRDFKGHACMWGYAESVLVDGDKVIATAGGPDAAVVALDKRDGKTLWTSRGVSDMAACGSPIAFDFGGKRLVATVTARSFLCLDASDGRLLWRYDRPSGADLAIAVAESWGSHNVSTPFFADGLLGAFNIHCSGGVLRLKSDGGVIAASQAWDSHSLWPKASGTMALNGYLYGCSLPGNGAAWTCLDLRTGKTMFYAPSNGLGGPFLYADGMFYCTAFRSRGTLSLVEASPKAFQPVSSFAFPETVAYPALSDGRLFVRAEKDLYIYDVRAKGVISK